MQGDANRDALDQALGHPIRADLIRSLWHRGSPASARDLQRDHRDLHLSVLSYHLRVLAAGGIAELHGERGTVPESYVVGGPNAGEAIRRLRLS